MSMKTDYFLGLDSGGFHKIAVHVWGAGQSGVPVVCVHGLWRTGRDFDRMGERLGSSRPLLRADSAGPRAHDD